MTTYACGFFDIWLQVMARALGPHLLPLLWEAAPEGRSNLRDDEALRQRLLLGLDWEAFKGRLQAERQHQRLLERKQIHGSMLLDG